LRIRAASSTSGSMVWVTTIVGVLQGWTWKDEGKISKQHKWGFISRVPGSRLDIEVNFVTASHTEK